MESQLLRVVGERIEAISTLLSRRLVTVWLCKACGRTTTEPMPALPWSRSKFSSALVAHVVYQEMGMHIPLDRQRRDWVARGVPVAITVLGG